MNITWLPKKSVVVPLDFSDFSFAALEQALEFVDSPEGIHVVHVLPRLSPMEPGVIWGTIDDDSRRDHAIQALKDRLTGQEYRGITIEIRFGDAARQVARYAEEIHADLIVVPSHGRTGASHVLIGSTAERIVRNSHCPVLVLRNAYR